ncbi:hypothetical protein ACFQ0D_32210, partial [Micromonospora zhanjiangensis]
GARLAYSAQQTDGGARIVVADADGANPRLLAPPGTEAGDYDIDPTWSPNGDAIAFTRQPGNDSPSRILVVAVADARLLAEVPMPAYLRGDDGEPSWSPDGRQLAFARYASTRGSDLETPVVDRTAPPGSSFTVRQSVRTPEIPPRPDIVFLVDNTGSMAEADSTGVSVIQQLRERLLPDLVADIRRTRPDARFGLATFGASDNGVYDPKLYDPRLSLTSIDADITGAVKTLAADSAHSQENWFYALRRLAANDRIGFSPDRRSIVVLISDTNSVDQTNPDRSPISREEVLAGLQAAKIALVGVPIKTNAGENGLDYDGIASWLAGQTGGLITPDSTAGEMLRAITEAIGKLQVTVTPSARCDDGLSVGFDPDPARVPAGQPAVFTENVSVAPGAAPGTVLRCTLRFDLDPPEAGADVVQDLIVRVTPAGLPLVRVDDVRVPPAGSDGARVTYE